MNKNETLEGYAQELLGLVSSITMHDDYRDFQHVSEKIKDAVENGNALTIHSQYPFLTDMFFHVIIAELKSQSDWLDWLWENDAKQMIGADKKSFEYVSLLKMISSYAHTNSENQSAFYSVSSKIEEDFKRNLDDMETYLNGTISSDEVKNHIVLAKFQLKFIRADKRKEYLAQYISILKKLRETQSVCDANKLARIIDFFIEKYENIPMNFCNDDEFEVLGSSGSNALFDKSFFNQQLSLLSELHTRHNEQANHVSKRFSGTESSETKDFLRCWNAVNNAQIYSKTKTPDKAFYSYVNHGIEAQMLLHKICANRYYHIDRFGSGKIPAKHLDGRFDRTGQHITVDYVSDGIAIDVFSHIIQHRIREYLDGEHSDAYLTSIIDNVCADKIDTLIGADRVYKASGENTSTNAPVSNSQDGEKTKSLEELLPAREEASSEEDYRNLVLKSIKKHFPELYLYLELSYRGVTAATLSALRNNGFAAQAESLTIGQDLKKQEILEIIGKGGNAHYFKRSLEKLIQKQEFREIPELKEISQEIIRFLKGQ